jgi:hypothetical protein
MLEDSHPVDQRRAAAKRTALVLATIAIAIFVAFVLKALSL